MMASAGDLPRCKHHKAEESVSLFARAADMGVGSNTVQYQWLPSIVLVVNEDADLVSKLASTVLCGAPRYLARTATEKSYNESFQCF